MSLSLYGERTPEQKALEALGVIVMVWGTPPLFDAMYLFEGSDLHVVPRPLLRAWGEGGEVP